MPEVAEHHRALVVDDNEADRQLVAFMLDRLGHTVTLACNGADAVRLLRVAQPPFGPGDRIVTDCRDGTDPNDGYGIARLVIGAVQKHCRGTPVVVVSANDGFSRTSLEAAVPDAAGLDITCLAKPFSLRALRGAIATKKHRGAVGIITTSIKLT